ncbi:MAG: protein kinase [Candidatus Sedimenticola sp. (ex Thyasira tokunagai)]
MSEITEILEAFTQGRIDFAGLFQGIDEIASENPTQIPELITQLEGLYRQGRLPPQLYNTLRFHLQGVLTPDETPATSGPSEPAPGTLDEADRTRISTSGPATGGTSAPPVDGDATRIATAAPGTSEEERTRITSRPPTTSTTGGTAPPTTGTSPPSTTGIRTSTRHITNEPVVGDVLKDRFVLEEQIGRGGMGVVFKALDKRKVEARDRHPYVALKLLNESFKQHEESLMALQREARKAQDLKHPNVIGIFDFDKDENGNYFIAMEFLEGEPLDTLIKELHGSGMPPREAIDQVKKMGLALAAGHNHKPGIIHSDFKPGNVFLTDDGDIKVFDFGIARAAKPKGMDAKGETTVFDAGTLGALTPTYASLEMLEGDEPDPRDDIYALAIVTYELLTGTRPYGRTPANKAMHDGMSPARIKGLSSRQWRGLERGLAFKRQDRTPSVEEFLEDLRFRKSHLPLIFGLTAVGAGLLTWALLPQYLEKRRVDELITAIEQAALPQIPSILKGAVDLNEASQQSLAEKAIAQLMETISNGTAEQIRVALITLQKMPPDLKQEILSEGKDAILAYYQGEADSAFAPQEKRFDYITAEDFLTQVSTLYPDSVQVFKTQQRMDEARNNLLNELDSRFNENLAAGRLLPTPDKDDAADVLLILGQLDPKHPLLTDRRLAVAYTRQATTALGKGEFKQADRYVQTGLAIFPSDVALSNIQARIQIAQKEARNQAVLAGLREELQQKIPATKTLDDYRGLNEPLRQLSSLSPNDPLLVQAEKGLQSLLDTHLADLITDKKWAQGENLLEDFSNQLSDAYLDARELKLSKAQGEHEERINTLFTDLANAITERRLTKPTGRNAMETLAKARNLVPDDPRIEQNLAALARTYLDLARESRAKGEWDPARSYVQQGLALKPLGRINEALNAELPAITSAEEASRELLADAERQKLEQERQEKIQAFYTRFDQDLKKMKLTTKGGRKMLAGLDKLAALNPTDPLLEKGRQQIAGRFVERGEQLSRSGDWQGAIALVQKGISVIPESPSLATHLGQLQQGFENQKLAEQTQDIEERRAAIEQLIAQAKYTNGWVKELTSAFRELENRMTAEDPWLVDARERTGRLYLEQALKGRTGKQFAKAGALLQQGQRFAPTMQTAFNTEQLALQADEQAWEKENQEHARLAGLEGAKQSLLTQAKANDTTKALKTLEQLRGQLEADDPFLTKTGPEAIASAYLRLAERRAKRDDFTGAIKLVENGLEAAPSMSTLQESLEKYRQEAAVKVERTAIAKTTAAKLGGLKPRLERLKQQYPQRYQKALDEFATILAKRVDKISNAKTAQQLLDAARKLLPNSKKLQNLTIKQPPQPSVIAAKGLSEVKAGRLSSARKLLDKAKSKEAGHPDLKRLSKELEKKRAQAEAAFGKYKRALKANDRAGAKAQLKQALAIWKDNATYKKRVTELSKAKVAATAGYKERCNPKFAGYGKRSSKFRCSDSLGGKSKGPIMVVVPPGGGHSTPYAIGRYEISIGDYNLYCKLSRACTAISGKKRKLPVTGITLSEAKNYATWLSGKTGATYRLPNLDEWAHAATASGKQIAGTDFNCLLLSGGATVKGGSPVNVNTAPQNPWGIYNYVGNVQELILSGSASKAAGGHYNDPADNCSITLVRNHTGGADELTGFRLLREIKL